MTLFRACLRIVRILRSKASWSAISGLQATIAWLIHGIVSMTVAPSPVVSVGTSRQPIEGLSLGLDEALDMLDRDGARPLLPGQKAHRDRVPAGLGKGQPLARRPIAQQRIRHLDEAAGPVADQRVGPDGAAMVEIDQDLQTARDDVVRFSSLDVGDETDAARIMLVARVVESLSLRQCHRVCSSPKAVGASIAARRRAVRRECHNMHKIGEDANRFNAGLISASIA